MDHSKQALTQTGPSFRFQSARLLFIWSAMALIAAVSHGLKLPYFAFALLPLVLVFQRLNAYRFLVLVFSGYLVFFPPDWPGSFSYFVFAGDIFILVFVALAAFTHFSQNVRIPLNGYLIPLYAFTGYGILLVLPSVLNGTRLDSVAFDLKSLLFLLLTPLLLQLDFAPGREPKKAFLLLLSLVGLTSLHAVIVVAQFIATQERVESWNEIFVSDAIILSALLLRLPFSFSLKTGLWVSLGLNTLALIAIQTRGLWISTLFALICYALIVLFTTKRIEFRKLVGYSVWGIVLALVANFGMSLVIGQSLTDLFATRLGHFSFTELANPYSSMGYRLHESWAIWDQRTFFGHGTGATIRLFFTQMGINSYTDWWAIHSGYFELLHKFGFLGLALFAWMYCAFVVRAVTLLSDRSFHTKVFGGILITILINHAVISITSGYFLRWAVLIWVLLLFGAEKLSPMGQSAEGKASST